jgi:acetyl esterase/lipase
VLRLISWALATAVGAVCVAASVWIYVPAPTAYVEIQAVRFSEHTTQLILLGLFGVGIAILGLRLVDSFTWYALPVALNLVGVGLSLGPTIQAYKIAVSNTISLDAPRTLRPGQVPFVPHETAAFDTADGETFAVDIYRPLAMSGRSPAVIVVHGGGWSDGSRTDYQLWHEWLAQQGFVVFTIDYELHPQPNWPQAVLNVQDAVEWVRLHADTLGVDPARIALLGRSAGAHLALLAAYTQPGAGSSGGVPTLDPPVQAVVALYGPTDLAEAYAHPVNERVFDIQASLRAFLGGDPQSVPYRYSAASPVTYVAPGARVPPTLLVQGGRDQLVQPEQMALLADRLRRANAQYEAILIPYAQHAFDLPIEGWSSQLVEGMLLQFLNRTLTAT